MNEYRRFIDWRKEQDTLITGSFNFIEAPGSIVAFVRKLEDTEMLCVFNTSENSQTWEYQIDDDSMKAEEVNHNLSYSDGKFEIAPYGYGFFSLKNK